MQKEILNSEGLFVSKKERKGYDPYTAEYYYYDKEFKATLNKADAVAFTSKSNGVEIHFARFTTKLVDVHHPECKIEGNFIKLDKDIFNLYRGYAEKGNYAGYVEANNLIGIRGLN